MIECVYCEQKFCGIQGDFEHLCDNCKVELVDKSEDEPEDEPEDESGDESGDESEDEPEDEPEDESGDEFGDVRIGDSFVCNKLNEEQKVILLRSVIDSFEKMMSTIKHRPEASCAPSLTSLNK